MAQISTVSISLLVTMMLLLASPGSPCAGEEREGIFPVSLELPPSLEGERQYYREMFTGAHGRVISFACSHGWTKEVAHPLLVRAFIFGTREGFQEELRRRFRFPPSREIPGSYAAIVKDGVLLAVSREIYAGQYKGEPERDYYEKLICHELLHELHMRIVHYREEQMGPAWFYEGFAIHGSGQFEGSIPELTEEQVWKTASSSKRAGYRIYAAMMRFFLKFVSLREMVERAGAPDFIPWLRMKVHQGQGEPGHSQIQRILRQDFHERS